MSTANATPTARKITNALLVEIPKRFPARVWRRNVGATLNKTGQLVRFGVPGEADITGIIRPGIRLEIEVKAGRDRLTEAQDSFLAMVKLHGGIAIVAHDVEIALYDIEQDLNFRAGK